jgi:hypothetical protein
LRARRHQQGYVFRKGNGWYLRYYDYAAVPDGTVKLKPKCKKLADYGGQFRSRKSVRGLADEFLRPFNDGSHTIASGMTVKNFVENTYLPYVKEQNKPSTYNGYCKMWNAHLKNRMSMPLRDFKTVDCESLLTRGCTEARFGHQDDCSHQTPAQWDFPVCNSDRPSQRCQSSPRCGIAQGKAGCDDPCIHL